MQLLASSQGLQSRRLFAMSTTVSGGVGGGGVEGGGGDVANVREIHKNPRSTQCQRIYDKSLPTF